MASELTLECLAIGSLPCDNLDKAMEIVKKDFNNIPFWPQLTNISKKEDMLIQFSDEMSSFYSVSFNKFLELIKETKPKYAKGQITGPFTLSLVLQTQDVIERLTQKALWQINEIKKVSPHTIPIIFIDEPSLSNLKSKPPVKMIKSISDRIKENGGMSGLHCCGNCDWTIALNAGIDIISFDAYSYIGTLGDEIKTFLAHGGKIAWGIVPTKDKMALESANLNKMIEVFENGVKYLTKKGIDEKIIIENSLITPSCGAGSLSEELAEKAMNLTKQLSENRKALWHLNLQ